jgi:glycosyltransferase involved in cell wall biosynthesis
VAARYSIAHVTPHPWEARSDVNLLVERSANELARRGHRVLVIAPSRSSRLVRDSRRALREARDDPERLLGERDTARVFAPGEVLGVPAVNGRPSALPIDVARTIEELLGMLPLDFVHVHEPFGLSTSSAALRHSRALNVGSFHAPTERLLATQVARRVTELFLGRLDARIASFEATRTLLKSHFAADYRVVMPGADVIERPRSVTASGETLAGPVHIAFVEEEERQALRLFLRALRRLRLDSEWRATVVSARGASSTTPLRAELRERVRFATPEEFPGDELLATADIVVCASDGSAPAPGLALRAIGAGAVPLAPRLAVYDEALGDGEHGLLFSPREVETLAAQLQRLVVDVELRARLRAAAAPLRKRLSWTRVADEIEQVYEEVAARRHDGRGDAALRRRLRSRRLIDVDLHMHTDHSPDCATPVEVLLQTAKAQRLGAIAITDHNEISGALEAEAKADGIKVIVAEEVKTATQGEVIGLFIRERIPRGLDIAETVAEIKRQGGLVYIPHPFDRLHAVPDYEHLLPILDDVDAIEVYNPRVAIGAFNDEAARFAAKYRIVAGAGSDSHVAAGLGSVRIRMRDFEGPREFLESLRAADIVTKPTSLLYVQALKFLETKATPAGARRARRERRVRRALRKS